MIEIMEIVKPIIAAHWSIVSSYTIIGGSGYLIYERRRRTIDGAITKMPEAVNAEICIVSIASEVYDVRWKSV